MDQESQDALRRYIPPHCQDGMRAYIEQRQPVGNFLTAVLENNLMEACARGDDINRNALHQYSLFLYNYAPSACYGSKAKVTAWLERHDEQRFKVDRDSHCTEQVTRTTLIEDYRAVGEDVAVWVECANVGDSHTIDSNITVTRVK